MKRFLFLTLLSCACLCVHATAGMKNKNGRDEEEKRSISHDPVKVEVSEDLLALHFITPIGNISIQIIDSDGILIHEELLLIAYPMSYYFPTINGERSCRLIIIGDNVDINIPIVY